MTTAPPLAAPAESLDQRLQAAVAVALDTLVALATNRDEPGQARLAAAEILRFAARRKPEPPPRPKPRLPSPRPLTSGLGAMLDLLTQLSPPGPPQETAPTETAEATATVPAPAAQNASQPEPQPAAEGHMPGRTPRPPSPNPHLDPYARSSRNDVNSWAATGATARRGTPRGSSAIAQET